MPIYSTGPIEKEPLVTQLRLKTLNNSNVTVTVRATIYRLNGIKDIFTTGTFTLQRNESSFITVNIPNLVQYEVQFEAPNANVLVAAFAVRSDGSFSASDTVRSGGMVTIG
ncbi:MAG TPA: hypothetical protein VHR47_06975 [Bacillota bacterium]|jgi:hypothetical protein|nr:hypothetical protein [Bacillota bacterium]